jgi:hypothetical protein
MNMCGGPISKLVKGMGSYNQQSIRNDGVSKWKPAMSLLCGMLEMGQRKETETRRAMQFQMCHANKNTVNVYVKIHRKATK